MHQTLTQHDRGSACDPHREHFERSADPMLVLDDDRFVECNPAAAQLLGYASPADVVDLSLLDISPSRQQDGRESAEKVSEVLNVTFEQGSHRFDWCHRGADGRLLPIEVSLTAIHGRGPRCAHVLWRDLRNDALRTRYDELQTLYRNTPAMLHSIDTRGRLVSVSQRWLDVLGYEECEVLGRKSTEFLTPESREYAVDVVLPAFYRDGFCYDIEYQMVRKDGAIIDVLLSATSERDANGNVVRSLAVVTDISERRRLETQIRQSQKMEAVGRLAAGVAHDFNNLLTVIGGNGELLLAELREEDPLTPLVEEIRTAGESAAALTRQLLAFSRKQMLQPTRLDLNAVVDDIGGLLRRLLGVDVSLAIVPGEGLGTVNADPGQIEQIIVNLAVNARDAMPGGGQLTVSTANVTLDDHYVRHHMGSRLGEYVMVAVSDTGIGIPEEQHAYVFEPFFTTKPGDRGTGLGLATVYGIVKQSDGYIELISAPGEGATFKIYLPRCRDGRSVGRDARDSSPSPDVTSWPVPPQIR